MPQATTKAKAVPYYLLNGFSKNSKLVLAAFDKYIGLRNQPWPADPEERKKLEIKWRNDMAAANSDWNKAFYRQNGNGRR